MCEVNYIFDTGVLKKGDILLINTYNERMQKLMKSPYDHVALYAGDAFIMESDGGGVVLNHVFSYGFKSPEDAIVLRCISDSEFIREGVVFYAKSSMGMEFGSLEARKVPMYESTENPAESNRMFCSRLVALSYDKMGVQLVPNPSYCSPASFLDSDKLIRVDNALVVANEDARIIVAKHKKARETAENVEMLVDVFQKMSKVFETDIQSMEQLIRAALLQPEKEGEAVEVLMQTDYYNRRYEGRGLFCLDDKEAFEGKYETLERRIWFLMNQRLHLENTYIPSVSTNALTFAVLHDRYPESKVIRFFGDFFCEAESELKKYHTWVITLLREIIDKEPETFRKIVEKGE